MGEPTESYGLMNAKATIMDLELSLEEKLTLSGWLAGEALREGFAPLLEALAGDDDAVESSDNP